jgi:hypothetical protein
MFCRMTEQATVPTDRVAKARAKLEQLRADPAWIAQHPHPRGAEQRSKLKDRYIELCETYASQSGPGAETAIGRALVAQAASLSLRLEMLQTDIVAGRKVRVDDVVRLSGEIRRVLNALQRGPPKTSTAQTPSLLDAYLESAP